VRRLAEARFAPRLGRLRIGLGRRDGAGCGFRGVAPCPRLDAAARPGGLRFGAGAAGALTTSPASSSSSALAAVRPTWSMRTIRFSPTQRAAPAIEMM
jgi:hypothetical protein